jgi:hypothetical protein
MNGLSDLRTVGSQRMSRVWDGPQRHVTTVMLRKLGQTVNRWYYLEVLKRRKRKCQEK